MGKRLLVQRKGRGGIQFRAKDHLKVAPARYPQDNMNELLRGVIKEFVHEPGRHTPISLVELENEQKFYYIPPEGVHVGQEIQIGPGAEVRTGNVLPLSDIPDGTLVCNVEIRPGDGGKIARRSGTYAIVFSHEGDRVILRLPSRKEKFIDARCRATIGVVAAGGRIEKPFMKAGIKYYHERTHPKRWPVVRGVAMNPVSHPHGGGSHKRPGKPTTVARTAPPGQKVGHIAARKTGRAKRRIATRK
ncbi:MAG: 50S ribosomal protein L2 [Candidatus Korarchaeum sp.]|nr:50S ribosomal protein L2 [Candidatus Korarchaeum sp.]MDW8034863.1 50S ribosomal protein L2 [Candidatus Korarchaeum sp.]